MSTAPPSDPKVSDEELLEAVEQACATRAPPVAKTEHVATVESIPVIQQTVKRRLDALEAEGEVGGLQIGPGKVWWPIEDGDPISPNVTDWDSIDIEGAPEEFVKEHPEFPATEGWDGMVTDANRIARVGLYPTGIGFVVLVVDELNLSYIPMPEELVSASAIFLLFGFAFMMLGVFLAVAAQSGKKLDEKGVFDPIPRDALRDLLGGE